MSTKQYDLILWGATGFTGKLVAEYLTKQYGVGQDLQWAIAGRNESKLAAVKNELEIPDLPVVLADSLDEQSLQKLASQAKVVCSTVGPYAKYGSLLVKACVDQGTDYCDLTGEVQWIRRMINQYHEEAKAKGCKVVHCCGFDSVPSDLGVFFLQNKVKEQTGAFCNTVKFGLKGAKGGMSGGTVASLQNVLKEAEADPAVQSILDNPYSLDPDTVTNQPMVLDQTGFEYDDDFESWTCPFIMAAINTRIVRRSHALANQPYGPDFTYNETMLSKSKLQARVMTGFINGLAGGNPKSILRKFINVFLPKPGQGPTKAQREAGFFKILLLGKDVDGNIFQASVKGDADPGYGSTSKMLGEAAVCLAKDTNRLPSAAGVLTPSIALGDSYLERLQNNAGLTFKMH